ncbi:MAG: polysaccharide deacetylase family protein [Lachnospiraceae bacterium]|nr:polysaccharide deacetylase family protein [Lachnospiraceae bacterium]
MKIVKKLLAMVLILSLAAALNIPKEASAAKNTPLSGVVTESLNLYTGTIVTDAVIEARKLSHFYSTNRNVANVTKDGRILAISAGECTISDGNGDNIEVVVESRPSNYKKIALTFDDGPGEYSDELLDFLKDRGIHVTFFMIGNQVSTYAKQVKRMYDEGHELGNHTYTHPHLTNLSAAGVRSEIEKCDKAIYKAAGAYPTVMRPPYGSVNSTVLANIDHPVITWNVDTLDWQYRDADYVAEQVYKGAASGNIILVHEIHKTTIKGVKVAIDRLLDEGWKFVTVTELLTCDGSTLENGVKYNSKKTLIDGSDKK